MLFALALIPVIALLIFIYVKDKNDKEPIGLLIGLFFAGLGTVVTALIGEAIGMVIFELLLSDYPVIKMVLLSMLIVGPCEELGKYVVLRLITWKNKNFNYSYDAIVYSVFVSLGFAALENINYVFSNGVGTAILRMFTAIPGHACFAVFMGYFYSKAKYAHIMNDRKKYRRYNALSLIVPILVHGVYDAIALGARESSEEIFMVFAVLLWLAYVIAMFVVAFIVVLKASKNDYCIVTIPEGVQTVYRPVTEGTWICSCGKTNYLYYCSECGKARPVNPVWHCPKCGIACVYNFCGNCGTGRPGPGNK